MGAYALSFTATWLLDPDYFSQSPGLYFMSTLSLPQWGLQAVLTAYGLGIWTAYLTGRDMRRIGYALLGVMLWAFLGSMSLLTYAMKRHAFVITPFGCFALIGAFGCVVSCFSTKLSGRP